MVQKLTSNLSKVHETRDSLSSSCSHIVLIYLQPFCRNLPLKCASQPKIAKKSATPINTTYFGGTKSFKVIEVNIQKNSLPMPVMISSMSLPICNCFHANEPISVK